jgi:hypothetical protein
VLAEVVQGPGDTDVEVEMRTRTMAAATMGCGPAVVVQGFTAVTSPDCTIDDTSPSLSRGVLDLVGTTRYQGAIRARTARDADISIVQAEVGLFLRMSADEAATFAAAAAQVGGANLECAVTECRAPAPLLTPAVTTEVGVVDDERVLLVSTDLIPPDVGATLAAVVDLARELEPTDPLAGFEATLEVVLIDNGGGRSLPVTFVVDVCRGCLAPTDRVCNEIGATAAALPDDTCLPGQDFATATCVCDDGSPAPDNGCL